MSNDTMSAAEWERTADLDDEVYRPYYLAMANVQKAVDQVGEDAADGYTCREQADRLRERMEVALREFRRVAAACDTAAREHYGLDTMASGGPYHAG
jgi:hypothetical protein